MTLRLCKIVLTSASFLFLLSVVFNNVADSNSNYQFVRHVLSMDTTFPGNAGMGRALHAPLWHKLFYATIIGWEAMGCVLIGMGTLRMWRSRRAPAAEWQRSKALASVGLTSSLFQWYFAFLTVGGEWFLMWQSRTWNGQEAALRMFTVMGLSLIFLNLREDEPAQ
jgi:predicted small integral membrane protein